MVAISEFHEYCAEAYKQHWPHTMLDTSTHDTKRSEDVRARIHLLSEIPGSMAEAVRHWSKMNAKFRTRRVPGPQHGISALSNHGGRVADLARTDRALYGKGDARGQAHDVVDQPQ